MKIIFSIHLRFFLISMAIVLALGCPTKKTLLSTENTLISCSVEVGGKNYSVDISSTTTTGILTLPYGSDLSTLKVVAIKVSDKAKASLSAGSSIKVSNNTFTIGVTAEDGSVKNYTITVVAPPPPPNTEAKILSLSVNLGGKDYSVTVSSTATTGTLNLPYGSDVNAMKVATITVSDKANASLSDGSSITVSNNAFTIDVTAENGSVNNYTITVVVGSNTEAKILSLSVETGGKNHTVAVSSTITTGTLNLPHASDVNAMKVVAIKVSDKAKASLSAGSSITVSNKTFTIDVTAEDGSVNNYTITVVIGSNTEAKILSLSVETGGKNHTVAVSSTATTGTLNLPHASDVNAMKVVAIKVSDKAKVSLSDGSSITVSNNAFTIDVTAENGSVNNYTITVVIAPNTEAKILSLSVETGGKNHTVAVSSTTTTGTLNLPHGSNLSTLKVVAIKVSDKAKASLSADSSITVSNNTFTVDVTAENGSVNNYTITVVIAPNTEAKLLSFQFEKANNTTLKESSDITFNLTATPPQANVQYIGQATFVPTFTVSTGAKVYVNNVEQISGSTSQDFLNTVTYKVVAQSGTTQTYKIAINYTSSDFSVTRRGILSGNNTALTTAVIGEYMNGIRIMEIAKDGFKDYTSLTKLRLPNSLEYIGDYAFGNCIGFSGSLTIPSSVISIENYAFLNCTGFTGDLTLTSSLKTIGNNAFSGCYKFSGNLIIPNSVTSIGDNAFLNCSGFKGSLTLPSKLKSIGRSTFYNCNGFSGNLIIPNSVTIIKDNAFRECKGFSGDLIIPNSVTSLGNRAFESCNGFSGNLIIPSSVDTIGDFAFYNCKGFSGDLIIPNSVTSIKSSAFRDCEGFTGRLSLSNTLKSIGVAAFANCRRFSGKLIIPSSVTSIGDDAFNSCSGFNGDLIIPNSVTSIREYTFYGCTGFDGTLSIPISVKSIGKRAFANCTGIKKVCNKSPIIATATNNIFENVSATFSCP